MLVNFPIYKNYKKVIRTIWIAFFLFLQTEGISAFYWDKPTTQAYNLLLDLKIEKADSILAANSSSTENGMQPYLQHFSICLQLALSEDYTKYEELEDRLDELSDQVEDFDETSPYYNFCLGEMQLHRAYLNGIFDEKIKAFWNFKLAYKSITDNQEQYPYFSPHYKTLGLLFVLIGSIPEEYEWISNSLGFRGSIEDGIAFLKTCLEKNPEYETECLTYLSLVYAQVIKQPEKALQLIQKYDNNSPSVWLSKALIETKLKHNDKALLTFKKLEHEKEQFPLLNYLEGECYLNKLDYKQSEKSFQLYLKKYKGMHHIKVAYYKMAMGSYLNGNSSKTETYLYKTKTEGNKIINTDSYALESANRGMPNAKILKSRLLFDGGYFKEAEKYLDNLTDSEKENNAIEIEYFYRKAQILEAYGKDSKALSYFEACIKAAPSTSELYYGPKACILAGELLEKTNRTKKALEFYNKVFDFKQHDYKKSIRNEAKRHIAAIEKS